MVGRVQLVRSVIQDIMIYRFMVYAWPIAFLKNIDLWLRNFIWSDNIQTMKIIKVAWHKVRKACEKGELGTRFIRFIN